MTVEAAIYINALDANLPAEGDSASEGNDHIKLTKSSLKATFPAVGGPVTATHTELNKLAGLIGNIRTDSEPSSGRIELIKEFSSAPAGLSIGSTANDPSIAAYDQIIIELHGFAPPVGVSAAELRLRLRLGIAEYATQFVVALASGADRFQYGIHGSITITRATGYAPANVKIDVYSQESGRVSSFGVMSPGVLAGFDGIDLRFHWPEAGYIGAAAGPGIAKVWGRRA